LRRLGPLERNKNTSGEQKAIQQPKSQAPTPANQNRWPGEHRLPERTEMGTTGPVLAWLAARCGEAPPAS
jgi:hypothetical protein